MPLYQSANFSTTGTATGSWALWRIDEPEEVLLAQLHKGCFLPEELQQIKVAQRRQEWLACRLALQHLLPKGHALRMHKNQHGRPYLMPGPWHISLSHAFPYAAAALHTGQPIGLDVEQLRPQLLRIRHKFLSAAEIEQVGDDLRQLCLYWAAKEALYKLSGQPGLIFARDMRLEQSEEGRGLQAYLFDKPYQLHCQWHDALLMCAVLQATETRPAKAGTDFEVSMLKHNT